MSFLTGKDGSISMFRVAVAISVLGLLFALGGFVLFQFERAERRSPLEIDLYPGAEQFSQIDYSSRQRERVFSIPGGDDAVLQVKDFYQAELDSFYDNDPRDPNREQCERSPVAEGEIFPQYEPGNGLVPYEFRCEFDDESTFGGERHTTIRIFPGVYDVEFPELPDMTGNVVIWYDEVWSN